MSLQLIYWILMLIWLVLGLWSSWPVNSTNGRALGSNLLLFILLLVIGWQVFGSPVHH